MMYRDPAKCIALGNDILPDDDLRKITWEKIDRILQAVDIVEQESIDMDNDPVVIALKELADALGGYLPPRTP